MKAIGDMTILENFPIFSEEQSEAAQRWLANPRPMSGCIFEELSPGDQILAMGRQLERDISFHVEAERRGYLLSKNKP